MYLIKFLVNLSSEQKIRSLINQRIEVDLCAGSLVVESLPSKQLARVQVPAGAFSLNRLPINNRRIQ